MCISEEEYVSKSNVLRNTTDSDEEGRLLTRSVSMFEPPELVKLYKLHRSCSMYAYRMMTFKISTQGGTKLQKWKVSASQERRILFSFSLYWLCMNERIFETSDNQAIPD